MLWDLPKSVKLVRDRLLKQDKGDRAFVELLILASEAGLDTLNMACELALGGGIVNAAIVMNALRRLIAPQRTTVRIVVPDGIALTLEPLANCQRYDYLLGVAHASNQLH